jgi:GH25 family lysozyme M1 (1,4-beta-N-acetylmuramidase)
MLKHDRRRPGRVLDLSNNNCSNNPQVMRILVRAATRQGIRKIIFKISEGTGFSDACAAAGIHECRKRRIWVGGYHFSDRENPSAEAKHYVAAARAAGLWRVGDLRPILDEERGPQARASAWRDEFMAEVWRLTRHHTNLYTFVYFNNWVGQNGALWIADVSSAPGHPRIPAGLHSWFMHQYTFNHRLLKAKVSLSVIHGRTNRAWLAQCCHP